MAVSFKGILQAMGDIFAAFVPLGVDPILFYLTLAIAVSIIYLVLTRIEFFKESKGAAFLVALVISYFAAGSTFVTILVSKLFPNIGLAIMALLGVMLVLVFISPKKFDGDEGMGLHPVLILVVFFVIIWLTWVFAAPELEASGALDVIKNRTGFAIDSQDVAIVIVILVVIGTVFYMFKGKETKTPWESLFKTNR